MLTTKERAHLRRAIDAVVKAAVENSWKGNAHYSDVPWIEAELVKARHNLKKTLDALTVREETPGAKAP